MDKNKIKWLYKGKPGKQAVRERQWVSSQDLCSSEPGEGWGCVEGARKGELSRSVSARLRVNVDVSCSSRASACHTWQLKCQLEHWAVLEPLWQRGNVSAGLCCDRSVAHFLQEARTVRVYFALAFRTSPRQNGVWTRLQLLEFFFFTLREFWLLKLKHYLLILLLSGTWTSF